MTCRQSIDPVIEDSSSDSLDITFLPWADRKTDKSSRHLSCDCHSQNTRSVL